MPRLRCPMATRGENDVTCLPDDIIRSQGRITISVSLAGNWQGRCSSEFRSKIGGKMPSIFVDQRVLVAEDDYVVAQQMAHELRELGARIVGPVSTPDAALQLACEHRLDAAVLDINLRGGAVYPVADLLSRKGVPFLFATAYDLRALPERYAEVRVYDKAAHVVTLAEALSLELELKLQSMGTELRYSVRQSGELRLWEVRRSDIVLEASAESSNVDAKVPAFPRTTKRSH
jgi:CheY-like chemotaxis protein